MQVKTRGMEESANRELSAQLAAAFAWWSDAGVDCAFRDEPANWIAPPEEAQPERPPRADGNLGASGERSPGARGSRLRGNAEAAEPAAPTIDPASLPDDLAAFTAWWLSEPLLDDGRVAGRVPPRGQARAELMILVAEPEREDGGHLLSGAQGRLLDAMLHAMNCAPEQVYVASALPRHTPMADWSAVRRRGLGAALCRHVELAAPRRLIAFGSNVLSLLGHDPTNSGHNSPPFNQGEYSVPLFAAADLETLLARPRMKARFWREWLDWTGSDRMGS